jgi:hypothetical protein
MLNLMVHKVMARIEKVNVLGTRLYWYGNVLGKDQGTKVKKKAVLFEQ